MFGRVGQVIKRDWETLTSEVLLETSLSPSELIDIVREHTREENWWAALTKPGFIVGKVKPEGFMISRPYGLMSEEGGIGYWCLWQSGENATHLRLRITRHRSSIYNAVTALLFINTFFIAVAWAVADWRVTLFMCTFIIGGLVMWFLAAADAKRYIEAFCIKHLAARRISNTRLKNNALESIGD